MTAGARTGVAATNHEDFLRCRAQVVDNERLQIRVVRVPIERLGRIHSAEDGASMIVRDTLYRSRTPCRRNPSSP